MSDSTSAQQWLRACSLVIADATGNAIELAGPTMEQTLRIRFNTSYQATTTPATLNARVYNLSTNTINTLIGLASKDPPTGQAIPFPTSAKVILKAGYQTNFAQVFQGQIYQMRVGKENSTDSYLDIFAADGDLMHAYGMENYTFASGYKSEDVWNHITNTTAKNWGVSQGTTPDMNPNASPRGRVIFGRSRDILDDLANSNNFVWNIRDMQLHGLTKFKFDSGTSIKINSATGMIGIPEQTNQGIKVTALLNPALRWGTHVQLNNADIARLLFQGQGLTVPTAAGTGAAAPVTPLNQGGKNANTPSDVFAASDGEYVIVWVEHVGDTRGNEWYSKFACISVDTTSILPQTTTLLPPPFGTTNP